MDRFDFVIIGAGPAGEAAAHLARARGRSVALVERDLVGGSCAYWACMPSKALLHAASEHAHGGDYPWQRASDFRDWMISREGIPYPDDSGHAQAHETEGTVLVRGTARIVGPGRLDVESRDGGRRQLEAAEIVVAVGTDSLVPPLPGLGDAEPWTNREGTAARDLPRSLGIIGAGPTGIELAQVYARYGVRVTLVHPAERLLPGDHPRTSAVLEETLRRDGVELRPGVRAESVHAGAGVDGAHVIRLSDGSRTEAERILLAVGRTAPLPDLGLASVGVQLHDGRLPTDGELRLADGVWVAGDPAGPEMHTHVAHYQGELVVRMALGEEAAPDYRAIPRCVYTDPEAASVGLTLDQAREAGHDAEELSEDLSRTAKGFVAEATGHVTIVVDRRERELLGAFIAGPAASETIHEAVLAIRARVPLDVLADTIHAFPTVSRVLGSLFVRAARELGPEG